MTMEWVALPRGESQAVRTAERLAMALVLSDASALALALGYGPHRARIAVDDSRPSVLTAKVGG